MIFTEFRFIVFYLAAFIVYWIAHFKRARIAILTLASFIFYGAWDWRFLGLIGAVIAITYIAQSTVFFAKSQARKRIAVATSVSLLLLILGVFKYFGFFTDSMVSLLQTVGIPVSSPVLDIILPVGVSFYIFQAMGYIIDVARHEFEEPEDLLSVAFFISFFPQLVAGPIVRAQDFFPQMQIHHRLRDVPWSGVIVLFVGGFFKKAVIADNIGTLYVDPVFADPAAYSNTDIILGVFAYATQIYCDFSGYSDMAIAVSRSFGYQLPVNFRAPYFSTSITVFWRRWHISLSNWLRDYLYISLGGNRAGQLKTYRNLMATMILGGLWHGASWNFLFWGYIHGAALALERLFNVPKLTASGVAGRLLGFVVTFYLVCVAWVFFRSSNFEVSLFIVSAMFGGETPGSTHFGMAAWGLFLALGLFHFGVYHLKVGRFLARQPAPVLAAGAGLLMAVLLLFMPTEAQPFIYFQF